MVLVYALVREAAWSSVFVMLLAWGAYGRLTENKRKWRKTSACGAGGRSGRVNMGSMCHMMKVA